MLNWLAPPLGAAPAAGLATVCAGLPTAAAPMPLPAAVEPKRPPAADVMFWPPVLPDEYRLLKDGPPSPGNMLPVPR